jgi:hypothetical protein
MASRKSLVPLTPLSLTTAQRDAYTASTGDVIYNSTVGVLQQWDGLRWRNVSTVGLDAALILATPTF